ncbi:glucose-induced degradation complex subunit [Saccharomycopsis crataegensis]|uniref:Glucose-induced degradation complex subunit n=1 Tax=Saccharomycopsis crataegensis TaxID=43959 RepID=A0AAV5QIV6_9ASCO|nr:glucose-induced degradation complex subunit [Saccharomycopsis crataegensis]
MPSISPVHTRDAYRRPLTPEAPNDELLKPKKKQLKNKPHTGKAISSQSRLSIHSSSLESSVNLMDLVNGPYQNLQSLGHTRRSPNGDSNQILHSSTLYPGSNFVGSQIFQDKRYDLSIELKYVDLNQSYMNGYLSIRNLTEKHPEITTFFEAELISENHNFLSRRATDDLQIDDTIDISNWSRFPHWRQDILPKVRKSLSCLSALDLTEKKDPFFNKPSNLYIHKDYLDQQYIYMRWKEVFLVPDATKKLVSASYDGIYYACLDQYTGNITGYYYHGKLEDQFLDLVHASSRGACQSFDFC